MRADDRSALVFGKHVEVFAGLEDDFFEREEHGGRLLVLEAESLVPVAFFEIFRDVIALDLEVFRDEELAEHVVHVAVVDPLGEHFREWSECFLQQVVVDIHDLFVTRAFQQFVDFAEQFTALMELLEISMDFGRRKKKKNTSKRRGADMWLIP